MPNAAYATVAMTVKQVPDGSRRSASMRSSAAASLSPCDDYFAATGSSLNTLCENQYRLLLQCSAS